MKKVADFEYKGTEYIVVDLGAKHEFRFGTISREFISEGKLVRQMNGLELSLETTKAKAVNSRMQMVDIQEMLKAGKSLEDVVKTIGK